MSARQRCDFVKADGERCRTDFGVNPETGYCWHHDPQRREEREKARALGGKHAAKGRRPWARDDMVPGQGPKTAQEAQEWSSWLVEATARGWISDGVSMRVATALNTFLKAETQAHVEGQIRELQGKVKELRRG